MGVDELTAGVGVAAGAAHRIRHHHAVVAAVAVGQQRVFEVAQERRWPIAAAAQGEVEDVIGVGRVAEVDPHPRLLDLARRLHGHGCVVGGDHVGGANPRGHELIERFQALGDLLAPGALGAAGDQEALALEDPLQPVKRQEVVELGGDDVGQQPGGGQTALDHRRRLGGALHLGGLGLGLAVGAGILHLHVLDALHPGGYVLQLEAAVAADHRAL